MKKILFIVGSYFPTFSAVGKCQYYLADEFVRQGYDVHVISLTQDETLSISENVNGQTIHRVIKLRKNRTAVIIERGIKRLSLDILDRQLVKKYLDMLETIDFLPDIIIPACLPFESIYASVIYKKKHPNCKVLPCLYDKFAGSTVLYKWKFEKKIKFKNSQNIEKKVFDDCDGILYVPSWRDYIDSSFPGNSYNKAVIEHPLITNFSKSHAERSEDSGNKEYPSILYAGMLTSNYVDAKYFINCISHLDDPQKIRLLFFAQGSGVEDLKNNALSIINHGWVKYDELISHMKCASILLSIAEQNGVQISSKIFEYMSMRKPIIHIYYVDNDVNLPYLRKYPLALCIKADDDMIDQNAERLQQWITDNHHKCLDFSVVKDLFYELTPEYICHQILMMYQCNQ